MMDSPPGSFSLVQRRTRSVCACVCGWKGRCEGRLGTEAPCQMRHCQMAPLQCFIGRGSVRWVQWGLGGEGC